MTEDKLNELFDLTRKQQPKVAVDEVSAWVNGALISVGFLAWVKVLLTKKLIMISAITSVVTGVAITTTVLITGKKDAQPEVALTPKVKQEITVSREADPVEPEKESPETICLTVQKTDTVMDVPEPNPLPERLPEALKAVRLSVKAPQIYTRTDQVISVNQAPLKKRTDDGTFDRVEVNGFVAFKLVQGTENKIVVNLKDDPELLTYEINDHILKINSAVENRPEEVVVMVKSVVNIKLNGFTKMEAREEMNLDELRINMNGFAKATMKANVKSLVLEMNGETKMDFSGNVTNLRISVNGMSGLTFNGKVEKTNLDANGDSKIKLTGNSDQAKMELNGMCTLVAENFPVDYLMIKLNGDCNSSVFVNKSLDADLNGMSKLIYKGTPEVTRKNVSGESRIKQR